MTEKKIGVPMEGLAELSRIVAAQGAVLLKNANGMLPFSEEDRISVFGRCQKDYYRSGTGSGGAVHVAYTTNLLDGMRSNPKMHINEELAGLYETFIEEHPFDNGGGGWAAEPWYQAEMPLTEEIVSRAEAVTNKALVVIGRTAGEDKDYRDEPGSYRLTETERQMLTKVCSRFEQVAVALNVSNIIDMSWLEEEPYADKIKAVIYLWHGGIEGGNAAADVLSGRATPSGKLTDTIAYSLEAYPSAREYGRKDKSLYSEDIYVGYRYFETFCPEEVQFPFGYGLSYTEFALKEKSCVRKGDELEVTVLVINTGSRYEGKEVVQVYVQAPQGRLGRPAMQLAGFAKTRLLAPGEEQELTIRIPLCRLAAYDDSGITGHKSCYVLEAGAYGIYVGNSVRNAKKVTVADESCTEDMYEGCLYIDRLIVAEELQEAAAPTESFKRLRPGRKKTDGVYEKEYEQVPLNTVNLKERIQKNLPRDMALTGNQGITFLDVKQGKASPEQFIAQLGPEELATLVRGEGMCSTKVTPGTAAAFGGVSERLAAYGIPVGCAADGPSGIRMDTGAKATQVPIGTLLACTWDTSLVEELFILQGKELLRNEVDTLLGPGINIHRNPLNGRNFEYFSEDPYITGSFAAAVVRGIGRNGSTGTVKHYACNNQETGRQTVNAVVSERALREVYLKGFEMAVKEGGAKSIMTAYNPVNGHWTASNYDLNTTILRKEWGYKGIVMTDWWARMNDVTDGGEPTVKDTCSMIRAQNDLYMVVNNNGAELNPHGDNTLSALAEGRLTIGELQRSAGNILRFLLEAPAADREVKVPEVLKIAACPSPHAGKCREGQSSEGQGGEAQRGQAEHGELLHIPVAKLCGSHLEGVKEFALSICRAGVYNVNVKMMSMESDRAQMVCKAQLNGQSFSTFQINGTNGRWILQKLAQVELEEGGYTLSLHFISPGMQIAYMELEQAD